MDKAIQQLQKDSYNFHLRWQTYTTVQKFEDIKIKKIWEIG